MVELLFPTVSRQHSRSASGRVSLPSVGPHSRQAAGGVGWAAESSRTSGLGLRGPAAWAHRVGVPTRLGSGIEPGGVSVVALEAARAAKLLSQEIWGTQPPCPQGATANAPPPYFGHGLLGTGRALSLVTILFNTQ